MTKYYIDFSNETPDTWTICVYQDWPNSPGLKSVAWKQTAVPRGGYSGVEWSIQYCAAISNYKQEEGRGVYTATQKLNTEMGVQWDIRFESGVQQLFENGSTTPGQLLIKNHSGQLANPAIGMDGDIAMVKSNVYSENDAMFTADPTYYIALFSDLVQGEVISGNQVHGPLMIKFEGGETRLKFKAWLEGATFKFGQDGTANVMSAPYAEVQRIIKARAELRAAVA